MTAGTYYARFDRALRAGAQAQAGGRLRARITLTLNDLSGAESRQIDANFELMGPGDVARLSPGAIVRRFPAPGSSDAEETKLAFVELGATDLPWRYTPRLPQGQQLEPWIVLVVGEPGAGGLSLRPEGTVRISAQVQNAHPLAQSALWAHVHQVAGFERARLLCPADLAADTDYLAAVVPAFTSEGAYSWTSPAANAVDLPCYDSWSFRTGPKGDFPDLAALLHRADLADLALRGGRPFGRADLTYAPRTGGPTFSLPTAGALSVPLAVTPDPADAAPAPIICADVAALQDPINIPDGRDVITAPDYGDAFTTKEAVPAPSGWTAQLRQDPRLRGAAGLGAWAAISWQEKIAEAAAIKLGDTVMAAEMIRALALGVAASRSMWRRRVPVEPAAALAALAPALARLPTDDGGTVLPAIAGRTPQLAAALFSSAARRALRPGCARSLRASPGANSLARIIELAAGCPDPTHRPDPLRRRAPQRGHSALAEAKRAIFEATDDHGLAAEVADTLLSGGLNPAKLAAVLEALRPDRSGRTDRAAVRRVLRRREFPRLADPYAGWDEQADEFAPRCQPVNVPALAKAVGAAIDPTGPAPPAARRVYAMLPGVASMRPLQVEPELDLPLWSFLATASPDWMLPGVGGLAEHEVVGVESNPAFVDAFLLGANWQAASELRWRNVPLAPRSSPLRRFWQRAAGAPPSGLADTLYDIRPVRFWPSDAALGDDVLSPTGGGRDAVVVFKSPLFRRYPHTVVYLYDARPNAAAGPDWDAPPDPSTPLAGARRIAPTFTGTIGTDVTFFGFPVPAAALAHSWVVLEEPPAGYRFSGAVREDVPPGEAHAGDYAHRRFALPVRVLLGPLL